MLLEIAREGMSAAWVGEEAVRLYLRESLSAIAGIHRSESGYAQRDQKQKEAAMKPAAYAAKRKNAQGKIRRITKVRGQKEKKSADNGGLPKVVSLFCGAGGLDWGFHKEGFEVPVAIDISEAAVRTHKRNFQETHSVAADLIKLQPKGVYDLVKEKVPAKSRIGVIGGPPCQGFSRANTASQANDPRNKLPQLYLEIVEKLQKAYTVEFVVFENVLGIRDKKHAATYKALVDGLDALGFTVTEKELCALDFGVPQNRRRVILSALRKNQGYGVVSPKQRSGPKTVREVIGNLVPPKYFDRKLTPADIPMHANHWTMQPKSARFSNPDGEYADGRSFKRLSWDEASPTIAFGHREIHVHPSGRRRLSIYEAMLLQGFPKGFVLEGNLSEQVEQVSNAVPPPLGQSIAAAVKRAMAESNKPKAKKAIAQPLSPRNRKSQIGSQRLAP